MASTLTWSVQKIGKTVSTQTVADNLANDGAAEGLVVVAEEQAVGKGRYGRSWLSPPGGLYMSLILRPKRPTGLQLLPIIASFAILEGIEQETGVVTLMRWPNDVMLQGKKVAGVIAEASYRGETLSHVVVGMGINCNFRAESLGELASSSATLMDYMGRPADLTRLRDRILSCLTPLYRDWSLGKAAVKISELRGRISTIGKRVEVKLSNGSILVYRATNIDRSGGLIVERDGHEVLIRAEDVEQLKEIGEPA